MTPEILIQIGIYTAVLIVVAGMIAIGLVQGAIVLLLDGPVDQKEIVRQTDYAILQMMGRIAHNCALLPVVPKTMPWVWKRFY